MVLILSNEYDYSTSDVIKWLLHFKKPFIRINEEDDIKILYGNINEHDISIQVKKSVLKLSEVTSYWFRRGQFNFKKAPELSIIENLHIREVLTKALHSELEIIKQYLHYFISSKKCIGNYNKRGINKIFSLEKARECGLVIPETIVTGNKNELIKFFDVHSTIITKPLHEVFFISNRKERLMTYTHLMKREMLEELDDDFFPSIFQNYIHKKYELRIFFLDNKCYSMGIFSQANKKTSIDFREYDMAKPNRNVPFKLPEGIEKCVVEFMQSVNLNCGSIDMIVSEENDFVFLEVNPVGQFGMTSYPCNYKLEKKIAEYLL